MDGSANPLSALLITFWVNALMISALGLAPLHAQTEPFRFNKKGEWSVGLDWSASSVEIVSNLAFVTSLSWSATNRLSRLTVLDLSNPTNPAPLGHYETSNRVNGLHAVGSHAYIAGGTWSPGTNDPGSLEIIDVSNPTNLLRVASITNLGVAQSLEVVGNYAYVTERERWTGSNSLGALSIIDVSNPANPIRVGRYSTNGHFYDLRVSGPHAYVAGGNADLLVLDVSNPTAPALLGNYSTNADNPFTGTRGGPAVDIDVLGSYVSAAGPDGLHVIDVSNPSAPFRVGGWLGGILFKFQVAGTYAFVGQSYANGLQGTLLRWWIFDVSQPPAIVPFSGEVRPTRWPVDDVVIADPYAYIASGTNGLLVFEVEPAEVPSPISVTPRDDVLILTWKGAPGVILQWTPDLVGPAEWIDVPGSDGQSSIELPMWRERAFFRLILPLL